MRPEAQDVHGTLEASGLPPELLASCEGFDGCPESAAPPPLARMAVELPAPGPTSTTIRVVGWAIKQISLETAGSDAIHVWALPVGGGPSTGSGQAPVFVGDATAATRVARPDVANAFGGEYLDSGFDITGTLAPGTYNLVVFARNSVTLVFDQMRIVRITVN